MIVTSLPRQQLCDGPASLVYKKQHANARETLRTSLSLTDEEGQGLSAQYMTMFTWSQARNIAI